MIRTTAYKMAQRFVGVSEVPGSMDNPLVLAMLRLDFNWPTSDEVPWCSGFCNFVCWLLNLPRSHSLLARSWLSVGTPIDIEEARPAFDVVVLSRGDGPQPGPLNHTAPGHVGFFSELNPENDQVMLLSGNQNNKVSYSYYPADRVLGVRRLKI